MTEFTIIEDFPKSEIEFDSRFSKPEACFDYLFKQKWPDCFVCRKCGHQHYWLSSRNLYICKHCEHQHSLTAGTIMDSSKKPIIYWFKAMWWFTTRKSGINAITLNNCWALAVMAQPGPGSISCGVVRSVTSVKNYPDALKSMSFSSVRDNPANGAEVLKAKPLLPLLWNDETSKNEWVAFVYMSSWIVQGIRWKLSLTITSHPVQP